MKLSAEEDGDGDSKFQKLIPQSDHDDLDAVDMGRDLHMLHLVVLANTKRYYVCLCP